MPPVSYPVPKLKRLMRLLHDAAFVAVIEVE